MLNRLKPIEKACVNQLSKPISMNSLTLSINDLFLNHRQSLIQTIYRIVGCPQTAEDLAHETYLKMLHASKTQEISYPHPFLYQIARNLALDHLQVTFNNKNR